MSCDASAQVWHHRLEARNLLIERGDTYLLKGVHCSLESGCALHLIGANGTGKSSLMRALCGLSPAASGALLLDDIMCENATLAASLFHYIGHATGVHPLNTPAETLKLWQSYYCTNHSEQACVSLLEHAGLTQRATTLNHKLSHGQQKRLALLRLQLAPRPFWFLDEVHTGLDTSALARVNSMLDTHLKQGGIVCFTAHDKQAIATPVATLILDQHLVHSA